MGKLIYKQRCSPINMFYLRGNHIVCTAKLPQMLLDNIFLSKMYMNTPTNLQKNNNKYKKYKTYTLVTFQLNVFHNYIYLTDFMYKYI